MRWFGEPWPSAELRAPICEDDSLRIPVPVGAQCLWCSELIEEGDRGEEIGHLEEGWRYAHRECCFRQVVGGPGHIQRRCTCCGGTEDPDLDMTPRQAALWVWHWYDQSPTTRREEP
jgi:hypothetical protein